MPSHPSKRPLPMPDEFEEPKPSNPLARYFRLPGVQVRLPTNGAFMPPDSIEFTMNNEVPVYPLRAADEMLLKTPDALMSGFAIESLLRSCVPAITAPQEVSTPDLDVLLMAIRAASTGETITLKPVCPMCKAENELHWSLGYTFSTIQLIEPENPVRLADDVVVFLRPHNLRNATRMGNISFEEARKVQAVEDAPTAERSAQISASMRRLSDLSTETLADCVIKVVVREGTVTSRPSIDEFIANIPNAWTRQMQAKLDEMNKKGIDKHYPVTCANCGHEWQGEIEFNPATFFV